MSETKRTTFAERASRGHIPPDRCRPACRSACRSAVASTTWMTLPTMAFSSPPSEPGGRVTSVKTDRFSAAEALARTASPGSRRGTARPMPVAASDRMRAIALAAGGAGRAGPRRPGPCRGRHAVRWRRSWHQAFSRGRSRKREIASTMKDMHEQDEARAPAAPTASGCRPRSRRTRVPRPRRWCCPARTGWW